MPAIGYGIRYEFGIFRQSITPRGQQESTDAWLARGNPVGGGSSGVDLPGAHRRSHRARSRPRHTHPWLSGAHGQHAALVVGDGTGSLRLRLVQCRRYTRAVLAKVQSETLSKVLYPNDELDQGKRLRLSQQIFFVSCSLQDMLRILKNQGLPVSEFHRKFAVQLNDTHPAIAVAELMRLLIDQEGLSWDQAWSITTASLSYTNHTLLPEALETWGMGLFEQLLPRQLEIIYDINARFLAHGAAAPSRPARIAAARFADRRGSPAQGAHGSFGRSGQPPHQRRGGAPQPACLSNTCSPTSQPLARTLHQRDERGHAAAMASCGQPGPRSLAG